MSEQIKALSEIAMLPIPTEYLDSVARALAVLAEQARLVMEFPLPEDTEPAALFLP